MSNFYDDAYMRENVDALRAEDAAALDRFNVCHRLTPDERDNLATFTATKRPELIRYGARLETPRWPIESMTITPTRHRVTTGTSAQRPTTGRGRSSGSSSSPCAASGPASSSGRSVPSSGARSLASVWRVIWYVPELIGMTALTWLAVVLFREMGGHR